MSTIPAFVWTVLRALVLTVVPSVSVTDSFVNSQEWTLSRSVPDLRLGIVGSLSSGKSALVHRYLTGSYMQEESPEGGRFKKEIVVDGQSYLLLIRDEGGPPELQVGSPVSCPTQFIEGCGAAVTACAEIIRSSGLQKWRGFAYLSADTSLNTHKTKQVPKLLSP